MKKFELTTDFITAFGIKLFRIKALVEFGTVKAGELGGYIEKEENLDHGGDAWVYGNARVYGDAWISGNARVYSNAWVCGDADYLNIGPIGSRDDFTTFYRCKDGTTMVVCGCFHDTIDAFEERVKAVHHGTPHEAAYLASIACARARINTDPAEEGTQDEEGKRENH